MLLRIKSKSRWNVKADDGSDNEIKFYDGGVDFLEGLSVEAASSDNIFISLSSPLTLSEIDFIDDYSESETDFMAYKIASLARPSFHDFYDNFDFEALTKRTQVLWQPEDFSILPIVHF